MARLDGAAELPAEAEATFQGLVPIAEYVAEEVAKHDRGPSSAFHLQMLRFQPDSVAGPWNAFRVAAGGSLPQPPGSADDELASVLLQLAVVQYPSFLLPRDPNDPFGSMGSSLFNHPLRPRLVQLIGADDGLSRLFTDDDPGLGRRGFVYTSLGHGFTLQSVMLGEMLLRASWDTASMSLLHPTFEMLCEELLRNLEVVRSAARGDSTYVRALVAFTGLTTGGVESISTPWGELRPLAQAERDAAPNSLSGAVTGTDSEGNRTTVSYAGELILDAKLPYTVSVHPESQIDFESWQWPKLQGADDLRHHLEAIQLSSLFSIATPPGSVIIARPAWAWIADPLTHGGRVGSWDVRSGPGFTPYQLRPEDCHEVSRWCERIAKHRTSAIDIAIRRVISVAQARTDPADRLVDSVIAWENLFGTREGEGTLRLTLALAWLLEPRSAAQRESLHRRLKELYRARSDIVHGNPFDNRRIAELANEAFSCAVQALAVLFSDRRDLLSLPDGAARSLRLMLGAGSEQSNSDGL
ncbi:MAG: HEPN domain-containing protein [Actinomycetota bacterium]|nr:HEPN domain-containing protein [Actinomycetota bacterium]